MSATRRIDIAERADHEGVVHPCSAEDGLSASLVLGDDVTVSIDSSYAAMASPAPRLTLFGSDAAVEDVGDRRVRWLRPDGATDVFAHDDAGERHGSAMARFATVIRDAVDHGAAPPGVPTFADGYACDLVLDQLRAAPLL